MPVFYVIKQDECRRYMNNLEKLIITHFLDWNKNYIVSSQQVHETKQHIILLNVIIEPRKTYYWQSERI